MPQITNPNSMATFQSLPSFNQEEYTGPEVDNSLPYLGPYQLNDDVAYDG